MANALNNSSDRDTVARRAGSTLPGSSRGLLGTIGGELKLHAPFTIVGALTGIVIMVILSSVAVPRSLSTTLFWGLHPLHVLLSALVTAGMYRLHGSGRRVQFAHDDRHFRLPVPRGVGTLLY